MDYPQKGKPCWFSCQDTQGFVARPLIRCNCGALMGCGAHEINTKGEVRASFYHREPDGCGWHVYINLAEWPGYIFRGGQDYPEGKPKA